MAFYEVTKLKTMQNHPMKLQNPTKHQLLTCSPKKKAWALTQAPYPSTMKDDLRKNMKMMKKMKFFSKTTSNLHT